LPDRPAIRFTGCCWVMPLSERRRHSGTLLATPSHSVRTPRHGCLRDPPIGIRRACPPPPVRDAPNWSTLHRSERSGGSSATYGDDGRQAAVADRQPHGVGPHRRQAAPGVAQRRRRSNPVRARASPGPGAAADLQADIATPAQQGIQCGADADRVSARGGGVRQELLLRPAGQPR